MTRYAEVRRALEEQRHAAKKVLKARAADRIVVSGIWDHDDEYRARNIDEESRTGRRNGVPTPDALAAGRALAEAAVRCRKAWNEDEPLRVPNLPKRPEPPAPSHGSATAAHPRPASSKSPAG